MFVRASIAPSNGEKDVALAWKTGGYVRRLIVAHNIFKFQRYRNLCSAQLKEVITKSRDLCIGPSEDVTRDNPVKNGDGYTGGTAFERNVRADPVKKGTRCYTIGNSAEGPTRIMAPNKNAKTMETDDDGSLEMRKSLELVRLPLLE